MSTPLEQLEEIKYFLEHRDLDEALGTVLKRAGIIAGIGAAGLVGHQLAKDAPIDKKPSNRPAHTRSIGAPTSPTSPTKPIATSADKPSPLKPSPFKGSRPHQESGWKAKADDLRKKAEAAGMKGVYKDKIAEFERTGVMPRVGIKNLKAKAEAYNKKKAEELKNRPPPKKRTRADWIRDGFVWHERSLSWIKKR